MSSGRLTPRSHREIAIASTWPSATASSCCVSPAAFRAARRFSPTVVAKLRLALVVLMALLYRIMSTSVKGATSVPMTDRLAALRLQFMASEQAQRIGQRIRARRRELGLETQRALAEEINVPTINNQVVSNWERGETKPSDENMRRLAAALKCDESYFYESDEATPDLMGALRELAPNATLDQRLTALQETASLILAELGRLSLEAAARQASKPPAGARPGTKRRVRKARAA